MNNKFLKIWAMAATAVALVLLGFLFGQRTDQGPGDPVGATSNERTYAAAEPEPFVIPAAFTSLPSEWRTVLAEERLEGYAILFDPPRREVIIEQCRHRGYFDTAGGQPVPMGWAFCDNVLWGQLLELDEKSAKVHSRGGELLDIELALSNEEGEPRLAISFPGHRMELVPGSKNDLRQAMENTPAIVEQIRLKYEFEKAEYQKRK